jgi:phosphomethylpyrimidine synthase
LPDEFSIVSLELSLELEEAEAGMAEMSKVYDETGRELYMGQGDREHD